MLARISSLKKGQPGGVQGGQLVQMLDLQRAQQAAENAAKKSAIATRNLVDATKEAEESQERLPRLAGHGHESEQHQEHLVR